MAAPHVTGAVALLKASRPGLTPGRGARGADVPGHVQLDATGPTRTATPSKLLDVSRIGPRGNFSIAAGPAALVGEAGGTVRFPITISRSATSFERIRLSIAGLPNGAAASFDATSVYGFAGVASTLTVTIPSGTAAGDYPLTVSGDEHGNRHTATATVTVKTDPPVAQPPVTAALANATLGTTTLAARVSWPAATDPSTSIAGYELQTSVDAGAWGSTVATSASVRSEAASQTVGRSYAYRVRARDAVGNWSAWAVGASVTGVLVQDSSTAVTWSGIWHRSPQSSASGGTTRYATMAGAKARTTFSGRGVAIVGPTSSTRGAVWSTSTEPSARASGSGARPAGAGSSSTPRRSPPWAPTRSSSGPAARDGSISTRSSSSVDALTGRREAEPLRPRVSCGPGRDGRPPRP